MRLTSRTGRWNGFPILALTWLLSLSSASCFVASEPFATPTPAEMSRLEVFVGEDSTDVEAVARLATGYLSDDRREEALEMLGRTHRRVPADPTVLVMLGIVEQELGQYGRAADRYETYLESRESPFAERVQARLDAIRSEVMRGRTRALLAGDVSAAEIDAGLSRPRARRIVVLPFVPPQAAPGLEVLSTALTWMVGRDLGAAPFEVVDRAVVRSLLEEMGVDPAERTELAVGLEVARLLDAGHVVQGRIGSPGPGRVSWELSILSLGDDGRMAVAPVPAEAAMNDVLRLEAAVVDLLRRSALEEPFLPSGGTASEQRSPSDLAAFLVFGRGLRAMDAGDFRGAQTEFEAALLLDPDFDQAAELRRRAEMVQATIDIPLLTTLEEAARIGELQRAVQALRAGPGSSHESALSRVGARERVVVPEVLGLDRLGGGVLLEITFTPSSGGGP